MKTGDLVKVNILDEKEVAIILEDSGHHRWNGRLHENIRTWEIMFADGSFSNEFEIDLELINEDR